MIPAQCLMGASSISGQVQPVPQHTTAKRIKSMQSAQQPNTSCRGPKTHMKCTFVLSLIKKFKSN